MGSCCQTRVPTTARTALGRGRAAYKGGTRTWRPPWQSASSESGNLCDDTTRGPSRATTMTALRPLGPMMIDGEEEVTPTHGPFGSQRAFRTPSGSSCLAGPSTQASNPPRGASPVKGSSSPSPIREDLHQADLSSGQRRIKARTPPPLPSAEQSRRRVESYVILPLCFLHFISLG
jgi:hypothetical protein